MTSQFLSPKALRFSSSSLCLHRRSPDADDLTLQLDPRVFKHPEETRTVQTDRPYAVRTILTANASLAELVSGSVHDMYEQTIIQSIPLSLFPRACQATTLWGAETAGFRVEGDVQGWGWGLGHGHGHCHCNATDLIRSGSDLAKTRIAIPPSNCWSVGYLGIWGNCAKSARTASAPCTRCGLALSRY